MKPFGACVLAIFLAACSLPFPGSTPVVRPASKILNPAAVTPREGAGAILIARDKQLQGMGCVHEVSLDDKPVAELSNGEQVTLYAEPGDRIVGVSVRPEGKCEAATARFPLLVIARTTTKIRVQADG
jgi:hypothetical protein